MYTTLVDVSRLKAHLNDPHWVIFDCRFSLADTTEGATKYAQAHIPGAHYAHLDDDLSGAIVAGSTGRHPLPAPEDFATFLAQAGVTPNSQIIAYDDKVGAVAARLWWMCHWLGHRKAAVLNGGFHSWASAELDVSSELPLKQNHPPPLPLGASELHTIEHAELQRAHGQGADPAQSDYLLIDAREGTRYNGIEEPIDRIPGHLPGALNRHFINNVDSAGMFLSPDVLKTAYESLIDGSDKTVVHYCGSGVTAAHNILAMTHAGLNPGLLYPGSFSQWSSQDAELCPVVGQHD
ncbi:MAG: sulfurtransferase [Gammaproteobacteria bacterium]|nr:sulfurtransferase [Gammaproteobacteria bacterium]